MVDNVAGGEVPADSNARIPAFVVDAGFIAWTVRADDAFGSAATTAAWAALESRQAFAVGDTLDRGATGIGPAWRRTAWVSSDWRC